MMTNRWKRSWIWLPVVALVFALACGGEEPAATATARPSGMMPAPVVEMPPPPAPTATPRPRPEATEFPEDLRQQALQLLERVAQVRNSPVRREVDMYLLSREQARAFYLGQRDPSADATPSVGDAPRRFDLKEETYVLLGLVPPPERAGGRGLHEQQIDNLISLITGFYSSEFNAFYMVETLSGGIYGSLARSTIVHELAHALQYQYVDIDAIARQRANDWDGMQALLSVLEGDAVNTEIKVLGFSTRSAYRQPACFTIPAPQRPGTPYVVERELDVWYEDGLCFVQAVEGRVLRGTAGIFEDLPTTMEQILHPEKYLAGEGAKPVTLRPLRDAIGQDWQELGRANFGEFGFQNLLLLGLQHDRPAVQAGAAGWGGDAFVLYGKGDSRLLYSETVWDASEEAREFFDTLALSLANRAGVAPPAPGLESYIVEIAGVTWRVYTIGDRVSIVVSTEPAAVVAASRLVERP